MLVCYVRIVLFLCLLPFYLFVSVFVCSGLFCFGFVCFLLWLFCLFCVGFVCFVCVLFSIVAVLGFSCWMMKFVPGACKECWHKCMWTCTWERNLGIFCMPPPPADPLYHLKGFVPRPLWSLFVEAIRPGGKSQQGCALCIFHESCKTHCSCRHDAPPATYAL